MAAADELVFHGECGGDAARAPPASAGRNLPPRFLLTASLNPGQP